MVWIILAIFLFFASYFTVTFIEPNLAIISFIAVILFALPSYYYLFKSTRNWLKIIISISILAYIIETIGILTGFPYTPFEYTELMGYKILGVTPLALPFAFVPLVIGAIYLSQHLKKTWKKITLAVAILVITDLILDPAAVALNIWIWEINGVFYGVPFLNFIGWIFTGTLAVLIFRYFETNKIKKETLTSLYLTVSFWTGATMWLNLWIPFIIGLIFTSYMTYIFYKK
ncbi:MAG: carotenoid biosynthesis protein [Candidatus Woesearchaeota archaeon]